jgi:DNA-binding NarL/FixJ family response regulator
MLQALADGFPPKQIASNMGITRESLAYHLFTAYKVLGCHCAAHAVAIAIRRNLIN